MKKRTNTHAIPVAIALMATAASTQAAVIFTDTFTAAGTGSWYKAVSGVGTLQNSSGELSWSEGGNGMREVIGRSFSAQTLSVGQTIRVTLNYRQNSSITDSILRVGLFNFGNAITADGWSTTAAIGGWSGYSGFFRDDSTAGHALRTDTGTTAGTDAGPINAGTTISTTDTSRYNIVMDGSTLYQELFELTLTSATVMTVTHSLNTGGGAAELSMTRTTSTIYNGFDTLLIKQAGGTAPALYDNIQVSVIPEPAAAALGALGALALLRRRRI